MYLLGPIREYLPGLMIFILLKACYEEIHEFECTFIVLKLIRFSYLVN